MNQLYEQKKTDLQGCLNLIRSGDHICFAGGYNQPKKIMTNLHTIADRVTGVEVIAARSGIYEFINAPGMSGHINTGTPLYSENFNEGVRNGNTTHIVCDIRDFSRFVTEHNPSSVFIAAASPVDEMGNFRVGLSQLWEKELLKTCTKIILEVNRSLPSLPGAIEINIKDVDAFFETDGEIIGAESKESTPEADVIADYIADIVRDGDCLELGTGTMSNVIAQHLSGHRELGLHSEFFNNGAALLMEKGALTCGHKNIDTGLAVASCMWASNHSIDVFTANPITALRPASYVCNPEVIRRIDNMVAINTLVEIDLTGQVCAESIGVRQISGSAGNFAFAYGATHSKGGKSILCFPAMTAKGLSKIKGQLTTGANVTIPRNYADLVITEYGVARMKGRSVKERVEQMINIAHPDVRADLTRFAREQFYI